MSWLLWEPVAWGQAHHPERLACLHGEASWSYARLYDQMWVVSRFLEAHGVQPGDRVALCAARSLESIAILLGIMHRGACALPLDTAAPPARLAALALQAHPKIVLAGTVHAQRLAQGLGEITPQFPVVVFDDQARGQGLHALETTLASASQPAQQASDETPTSESRRSTESLALVYFTSGSTGTPRGVMLSHRAVTWFVDWAVAYFAITPQDRLSSHAPFHFDLSTLDLFATFRAGATVCLLDETTVRFPAAVAKALETSKITLLYCVPTALRALVETHALRGRALEQLRAVLFAGEVFAPKPLSALMKSLPHSRFYNLYGPTETNVCTVYEVPHTSGPPDGKRLLGATPHQEIPLGRPCAGLELTLRRDDGSVIEGPEEIGEICIAGPSCMTGYLDDPEATRLKQVEGRPQTVRTGDLGAWRADGMLAFHGRRDRQVKVRGYRLELDEIEAVVGRVDGVFEAAALLCGEGPTAEIVVYFSPRSEREPLNDLSLHVRAACKAHLPAAAQPARVLPLTRLPHTSTGKLDRPALQALANAPLETPRSTSPHA